MLARGGLRRFTFRYLWEPEFVEPVGKWRVVASSPSPAQDLQPKRRLAKLIRMISDLEAEFIAINHHYRNEVYHRGQVHDRFIYDQESHR
jgi:hypothetical protein